MFKEIIEIKLIHPLENGYERQTEEISVNFKYIKRCSVSLTNQERQTKYYVPTRLAKM